MSAPDTLDPAALAAARVPLPSAPRVVAMLLVELAQPQPDLRRLDQLLSADPVLAARMLQAANAAHFGVQGRVASVSEALAVLRLGQVQAMVGSAATRVAAHAAPGLPMPQFQAYSLDCAKVARSLAALVRLSPQAAFSAGLIHALGLLVQRHLMAQALDLDARFPMLDLRRLKAEKAALGSASTEVSAAMARSWHLPGELVDALAYAHAPFDNDAYEPLAAVVHLAVWRARARQAHLQGNALTVTFPLLVAEVLGLDMDMVLQQDPIDWTAQPSARVMVTAVLSD